MRLLEEGKRISEARVGEIKGLDRIADAVKEKDCPRLNVRWNSSEERLD